MIVALVQSFAYQSVVNVPDPFPSAVRSQNLQPSNGLTPQNGDAANVYAVEVHECRQKIVVYLCVPSTRHS